MSAWEWAIEAVVVVTMLAFAACNVRATVYARRSEAAYCAGDRTAGAEWLRRTYRAAPWLRWRVTWRRRSK